METDRPGALRHADFDRRLESAATKLDAARAQRKRVVEQLERVRRRRRELQQQRVEMHAKFEGHLMRMQTPQARAAVVIMDAARVVMDLSVEELWLDYFALGGNHTPGELSAILAGDRPMFRVDYDRLVVALNERFSDAGLGRPLTFWDGSQ